LARATLEGIALQVTDLLHAMAEDLGKPLARMRVDGGAAKNDLLMQYQADFAATMIERPIELESTARGAAMLAGVGAGLFANVQAAAGMSKVERTFEVGMSASERGEHLARWRDAIGRTRSVRA
jgi:glycerol kinase